MEPVKNDKTVASADPLPKRRERRLGWGLLLASLALPLLAAAGWRMRLPLAAEIHYRALILHLERGDPAAAEEAVENLLGLPEEVWEPVLDRARRWNPPRRRWLADQLINRASFFRIWSTYLRRMASPPGILPDRGETRRLSLSLVLDPGNRLARVESAFREYVDGDYRKAADKLEGVLAEDGPGSQKSFLLERLLLGRALRLSDRTGRAVDVFRALLEDAGEEGLPESVRFDVRLDLIRALKKEGRYREAIRHGSAMLAETPGSPNLLLDRSELFGLLGRDDLALRDMEAGLFLAGDNAWRIGSKIQMQRAEILERLGRADEAVEVLTKVVASGTILEQAAALGQRSLLLDRMGQTEKAIRDLREALLVVGDGGGRLVMQNNLAWLLATARDESFRDPREALRLARSAVEANGEREPFMLDTLAEACYVNGRFAEAVRWETMALEKGGETYRPSLDRYREALRRHEAGETVALTPTPLLDHDRPLPGDGGATFDPASLPAAPRRSPEQYAYGNLQGGAGRPGLPPTNMLRRFAALWEQTPPAAADDPRLDVLAVLQALSINAGPRRLSPAEQMFLYDLGDSTPQRGRRMIPRGVGAIETASRQHGDRVKRFVQSLDRRQAERLLGHMKSGDLRLEDFYPIQTFLSQGGISNLPPPDQNLGDGDVALLNRIGKALWQLAEPRLRAAAETEPGQLKPERSQSGEKPYRFTPPPQEELEAELDAAGEAPAADPPSPSASPAEPETPAE